ncbi:MAG TPA: hypothetical protein DHV08_09115 [Rhodocyclaceae bacterium]|nr:hypothetical protein [Rhodocyclaceae bacterium]
MTAPRIAHGVTLDLQFSHLDPARRMRARLIGLYEGQGLIVTAPLEGRQPGLVREGDELVARYIAGRNICAFQVRVLRVATLPYRHVHLSYPERIEETAVRDAERVSVDIPAQIRPAPDAEDVSATISDLSATGAMIRSPVSLGATDAEVTLEFEASFGGQPQTLQVGAIVRNERTASLPDGSQQFLHGVRFKQLEAQQEMFLRGFVFETIALGRS